jgi:fructose 1,6-bisphosphatase
MHDVRIEESVQLYKPVTLKLLNLLGRYMKVVIKRVFLHRCLRSNTMLASDCTISKLNATGGLHAQLLRMSG